VIVIEMRLFHYSDGGGELFSTLPRAAAGSRFALAG
jgi:hypothetical protein